jgi:signal transduction histidine kinase
MTRGPNEAQDLTTTWKESIAVKIAAVVLYTTVLVGIVSAAVVLWDAEKRLERDLSLKADRLAFYLSEVEFEGHGISPEERVEQAEQWLNNFGFTAAIISRNGRTFQVGNPEANMVAIKRFDPTAPDDVITLYHPSSAEVVKSQRNTVVLVAVVSAIIFGLFLTIVIRKFITVPIQTLVQATRAATDGDLNVRADATREDEFGVLAGFFNTMLAQIQNRDRELELHRKHLEDQVSLRTAQLIESNEELKQFMYTVAHDLRQPLVNIEGFSAELKNSTRTIIRFITASADRCSAEERDTLNNIYEKDIVEAAAFLRQSVEQMGSLINTLLKLSQVGYLALKPEPISMNELTRLILANSAQLIREKHATVNVDDLPEIMGDRMVVEQTLKNLLDNALKYLDNGRPGKVEIGGEMTGDGNVVVHVRDNGRGISPDDMPKLFQVFRRLGKLDVEGAREGVGLAFSKALIKRHGGQIWCESELGRGSTFSFSLPRHSLIDEQT